MKVHKLLLVLLGAIGGLLFFWLFPLKLVFRLAARLGKSTPCPASMAWLVNNSIRRRYTRPVVDRVGVRPGERVLELGPGPGMFTVGAARRAGAEGRIITVDIQPQMIARVEKRVREAGLTNVETCVASAHWLPLKDESVDRAFLVAVLPEVLDQARALSELHRVLRSPEPAEGKPGGLLSITEDFFDPDYPFAFETIRRVQAAEFSLEQRFGTFWLYTLNFVKKAAASHLE